MASINYATRQISVKIVYYGPGLSGKTTNLQVIHKKTPQEHKSDMVSLATETDRTLFFDFLPLDLGKIKGFATKFQLYTVPGQVYYNATRKLVLRGVDGVVFVADSGADKVQENLESFQNLEDNLAEYGYQRESVPIIIQYNKRDLPNALPIDEMNRLINKYNLPWGEGIAYKGVGVFDTLKQIGKIVIDYLNKKYSRSSPGSRGGAAASAPAPAVSQAEYQPQARGFQQPPTAPSFQPQPMQGFQPPTAQGYQPQPPSQGFQPQGSQVFQPQNFQQQPIQGFQPQPPSFQPSAAGAFPDYQPPRQQSFAPPPQAPAYDSFEMAAPPPPPPTPAQQPWNAPPQQYQQSAQSFPKPPATAAFPDYQPPQQQSFAPPPPPPPSAYDSFEMAPPAPPQAPVQQPWSAPQQQYQQPAAFPGYQPPPSNQNYDDIFMVEPPPAPPQAPPPAPGGFSQNGDQGGYEQSPFSTETALPPPSSRQRQPLAGATPGGAGAPNAAVPQQQSKPAGQAGGYIPPQPQKPFAPSAGFQQPAAVQDGGGKSEVDLEIEKYQREIEDTQQSVRPGGGASGGFAPPPAWADQPQSAFQAQQMGFAQAAQPPYAPPTPQNAAQPAFQADPYLPAGGGYDDMASMTPHNSAIFEFEAELSAHVNKNNAEAEEEYPSDSAIFFSSINKNALPKKTGRGPVVNPAKQKNAQQQQKGFVSKFFNKNQ